MIMIWKHMNMDYKGSTVDSIESSRYWIEVSTWAKVQILDPPRLDIWVTQLNLTNEDVLTTLSEETIPVSMLSEDSTLPPLFISNKTKFLHVS